MKYHSYGTYPYTTRKMIGMIQAAPMLLGQVAGSPSLSLEVLLAKSKTDQKVSCSVN